MTCSILDHHLALHDVAPRPRRGLSSPPLPKPDEFEFALAGLFETTIGLPTGNQLEENLEEMLWPPARSSMSAHPFSEVSR